MINIYEILSSYLAVIHAYINKLTITVMFCLSIHFGCQCSWSDKRIERHHIIHGIPMVPTQNVRIAEQPDY